MARYVAAPELAWQHGQAGWDEARRRHSTEVYAAQIHEVLRGIQPTRRVKEVASSLDRVSGH